MDLVQWLGICSLGTPKVGWVGNRNWLVVYLPLWKILASWDDYSQYGKIKNVPNHQPDKRGYQKEWDVSIASLLISFHRGIDGKFSHTADWFPERTASNHGWYVASHHYHMARPGCYSTVFWNLPCFVWVCLNRSLELHSQHLPQQQLWNFHLPQGKLWETHWICINGCWDPWLQLRTPCSAHAESALEIPKGQ